MIRAKREAWLAVHAAQLGGDDWLGAFRIFHGLDRDLRPVGQPDALPARPRMPQYRHLLYAATVVAHEKD